MGIPCGFCVSPLECRYQGICVIIFNVLLGFRALENLYKLLVGWIILILGAGSNDVGIWAGVIFGSDGCLWIQLSGYSITAVDYGSIAVIQRTWELWSFQFYNLDVLWIGSDICGSSLGRISTLLQSNQSLLGQKEQCTAFIGRIVRNRDGCSFGSSERDLCFLEYTRSGAR